MILISVCCLSLFALSIVRLKPTNVDFLWLTNFGLDCLFVSLIEMISTLYELFRYYYNRRTRLSSWEKPLELMSPTEVSHRRDFIFVMYNL